ncbi:MAG TPA: POTRA domain-containing protein, partial [Bacteroidia bacterium]
MISAFKLTAFLFFTALPTTSLLSKDFFAINSTSHTKDDTGKIRDKKYVIINEIGVIGNKVTKKHIILRELPFQTNDSINQSSLPEKLKSAKQNLLNTSLFNFVTLDTIPAGNQRINVLITVAERWYTWPAPIFEFQERNFNEWWKNRNFSRANYGFYLNRENFRGRNEELSFILQFGYTQKYGIYYKIPYLTRRQKTGAGFSFAYARNHEIAYTSYNNQELYFKDVDHYVREEFAGKLYFTYRNGIHNSHYLEGKFIQTSISDTARSITTDYLADNLTRMSYLALDYYYKSDYRDSKQYPLQGHYLEFEANKLGTGILKGEKLDITNFYLTLKDYQKVARRFYLSGSLKGKFSFNTNQPYYIQKGLGWSDYVRGYEYYVIDGQRYGLAKLGLKYEIIKPHTQSIENIPFSKFNTFHYALYATIFGDAGYVDDQLYYKQNPLANTLLYSYGAGLDYVTYYDIVIRLE